MVKYAVLGIGILLLAGSATSQSAEIVMVESPTEGRITHEFVDEQQMKDHLLQMLADFSMICAFLVKYAQGKVTLPEGVTWDNIRDWTARSLNYAYSTHKANRLYACKNNSYWGSTNNAGRKSAPEVTIISNGKPISGKVKIPARKTAKVYLQDGDIKSQIL